MSEPFEPKPPGSKTDDDLRREWDAIAEERFRQIQDHVDISYHEVLVPAILELAGDLWHQDILDAGCGSGFLTKLLARRAASVVGVDLSRRQISLASAHNHLPNVSYRATSLQALARILPEQSFDVVVANMTLMDVLDLGTFVAAANHLLRPAGRLVFTITHPCFWPEYWGYVSEPWFRYDKEQMIEAPFQISLEEHTAHTTTHVHRPLSTYFAVLAGVDLYPYAIWEPVPSVAIQARYPRRWKFPRYLAVCCRHG